MGVHQPLKALRNYPTDTFTIFELQNPLYDIPELHKIRRFWSWCFEIVNVLVGYGLA